MLLYLIKYSQTNLRKVVRELSKCISTERFGMGGFWRYIPHVHIILDIRLTLSNRDNLQRYGKEFSST
jgi:hypothetical protein